MPLEPPYASFPYKTTSNKYEVRSVSRNGNFILSLFNARYAAARMVAEIIGDDDIEWKNTRHLITSSGYHIMSQHLEELVEHEDTNEQAGWSPTIPQTTYLEQFMGRARTAHSAQRGDTRDDDSERKPRAARTAAPTEPRPDGLVSLQDIAAEVKMDAKDARQILRKHAEKPAYGWAWAKDQVASIKKLLQEKRK